MTLIEDLSERLGRRPEVDLAVLFGSTARSRGKPGGDVDVALLLSRQDRPGRLDLEADLGRAAGRPVDVVYLDEAPPLLRFEIARDGVLLVERLPHRWADFKARAMVDWWDWAPTLHRLWAASRDRLRSKVRIGQA